MIYQLHHQYRDGTNRIMFAIQSHDISPDELPDFVAKGWNVAPPKECDTIFLLCNENSHHFVHGVMQ